MSTKAHVITESVMAMQADDDEFVTVVINKLGNRQIIIGAGFGHGDERFHISNPRVARQLAWQLLEAADILG